MNKDEIQCSDDEKIIKLIASQVKRFDGRFFTAFQAVKKDKRLIDARFTRECTPMPQASCFIRVKKNKINIDKKREYPVLWIKEIEEIYLIDDEAPTVVDTSEVDEVF